MAKKNFRQEMLNLTQSICNEIDRIVPAEGITFNGELRDELEDSDEIIPALPVYDDKADCAYYEDLYTLLPHTFTTIDDGEERPLDLLTVDDLVAIYEYLTDVYIPYTERRRAEEEKAAQAAKVEQLKKEGFFEFQGHAFKAYANLPKSAEMWEVNLGSQLHIYENGTSDHAEFYKQEGAGETDVFYMDGYDLLAIPCHYCIFEYIGLKKGKKLHIIG